MIVSTNHLDGCVLLPEGAAAAPEGLLVGWQGGNGAEICSPQTKVMLSMMDVTGVGETSSQGKTACLCLQQVFVMSSPAHLKLCWPQVLGGWKSATSPSLSLAPLECFAFSLVLVGFMASDAMPRRGEASREEIRELGLPQLVPVGCFPDSFPVSSFWDKTSIMCCPLEVELGVFGPLQH